MVRALERLSAAQRFARVNVELLRPIPMTGFRVRAEVTRPGRSVTFSAAEILDDDRIYARAYGMHLRRLDDLDCGTAPFDPPNLSGAVPGPFPIRQTVHGLQGFTDSVEVRYDPAGSHGEGGPSIMWMRTNVPILADEEASPFQRICPLADCGNGISHNDYIDKVFFLNTDLSIALHRDPVGEWFCSKAVSHWHRDGTGIADAELFDGDGPVGRALQNVLLMPAEGG
jgi:hypothetical protein